MVGSVCRQWNDVETIFAEDRRLRATNFFQFYVISVVLTHEKSVLLWIKSNNISVILRLHFTFTYYELSVVIRIMIIWVMSDTDNLILPRYEFIFKTQFRIQLQIFAYFGITTSTFISMKMELIRSILVHCKINISQSNLYIYNLGIMRVTYY